MTKIDLTGQRFGRLTVTAKGGRDRHGKSLWECVCECGTKRKVTGPRLKSGHTASCGCSRKLDLTGQRFGSLTVIEEVGRNDHRAVTWRCACDCGKERVVRGSDLARGTVSSCGCMNPQRTHGQYGTPLWDRWKSMLERTTNPDASGYANYGGRGVAVCERWQTFEHFATDMRLGFSPELTLERVDVNGGYEPGNCRWATRTEQARNKRNNHVVTFRGLTMPVVAWAELLGLKASTVRCRLNRYGWSADRALTVGANPEALARLSTSPRPN